MEAIIVITALKSLIFLYSLTLVFTVHPATASTPAAQDTQKNMQGTWIYYATDEDGADYALNPAKVERLQGNLVRVWVKAVYPEKNPKYTEGQFQWEIDCAKKTIRGITATTIKKDGTSATISEASDWSSIPDESTAETLYEITCNKKDASKIKKKDNK